MDCIRSRSAMLHRDPMLEIELAKKPIITRTVKVGDTMF
jgi:hypothetical protein